MYTNQNNVIIYTLRDVLAKKKVTSVLNYEAVIRPLVRFGALQGSTRPVVRHRPW